jgi:hypothetical protein
MKYIKPKISFISNLFLLFKVLKHAEEVGDLLNMRKSKLNPKRPFHETEL